MSTSIVIPQMGESISEAVVSSWLKADGAYVRRDEDIVELETDKVTMPLPAPASGVLKHGAAQGATVSVGDVVGQIDESAPAPKDAPKEAPSPVPGAAAAAIESKSAGAQGHPKRGVPAGSADVRSTPLARKLADEHKVDMGALTGTGPGGRVREQDVLSWVETHANGAGDGADAGKPRAGQGAAAPALTSGAGRGVHRERMSPLRQRIAVRLVEAQHTAAMLTTFNECDMSAVMELRNRYKDAFEKKYGVRVGFMSFFIKAAVSALEMFPNVNASIVDGDGGPSIEYHDYCDIAVAVGTEKGLVVPVLRNCNTLGFAEIEAGINTLATRARDGKLTLEDMQGGTFTISNGGVYGSMMSTPILNPPQSGILGMHNIIRRPVENPAKPGSGEVVVRPMMYLALSYDHRIVDGAGAVGFLKHIKECIEDPQRLLLAV
jgi:2-oxoglutarate dehydrogenase E2 component (dihydrolipoamide succinyltransferase)